MAAHYYINDSSRRYTECPDAVVEQNMKVIPRVVPRCKHCGNTGEIKNIRGDLGTCKTCWKAGKR